MTRTPFSAHVHSILTLTFFSSTRHLSNRNDFKVGKVLGRILSKIMKIQIHVIKEETYILLLDKAG